VSLDRVIRAIEPARRLHLVILDACRDNPFNKKMQRTMAMRAVSNGLAKIELTLSDTMVAYAAKAGSTAEDGNGSNSPFTGALLKHLTEPGLDVRLAFGRVRDEVWAKTGHRQEPFVYASLGGAEIPLVPVARKVEPAPPPTVSEAEVRRAYELTAQVATKEAWEAFLKDYKTGLYADLARVQLAKLAAPSPQSDGTRQATEAERAWDKVKDSNDRVAIRNFIELFPGSVHVPNAQHRLDILDQAAQEREAAARAEREAAKAREQETQRAKAAEIEKQREAARQREEEAQRVKAAEIEKRRQEREAAKLREEEAQRAKAADAEKRRQEREAAKLRDEEAQHAKAADAEKQRQEREAAKLRDEETQRAKAADAEKQRQEREAARRRDEEERLARAAEAERQKVEQDIAKRRADEEMRVKAAEEARHKLEREAALRLEQTCQRDEQKLARLKTAGLKARDDLDRLEKDLGCERLRPDVVALREQLTTEAAKQPAQEPVASLQPAKEPAATEEQSDAETAGRHRSRHGTGTRHEPAEHPRRDTARPRHEHERPVASRSAPAPRAHSEASVPRATSRPGVMLGY
jgi:hypothetical protein